MIRRCVVTLAVAALTAGCQFSPTAPASASWLTASIQGSTLEGPVSSEYSGTGTFTTLPNGRRPAAPALFLLQSQGSGPAGGEGFELSRRGSEVPGVGRYALVAQASETDQFTMIYSQRRGNVSYRYAARAGELHITEAAADRLAGTFRFTGAFAGTCTTSGGATSCNMGSAPEPGSATLDVSGAFEAILAR